MPDFNQLRTQLHDARQQQTQADDNLSRSRQALKQVQAAQAELDRVFDPQNEEHRARRQNLNRQQEKLKAELQQGKASKAEWQAAVSSQFNEFLFANPQEQVEQLRDDHPFLLFPVRLETRFKTIEIRGRTLRQLWVRIYPDDCLVDSFEAELSESEIKAPREFWANYWKAGGVEDQERAAWRSLVGSVGSGRAAWLVQVENKNLVLANPAAAKPAKAKATDIILVIPTETDPAASQTAVVNYWKAAWLADGDKAKTDLAFSNLKSALTLGDEATAAILEQWKPVNFLEKPVPPLKKTAEGVSVEFLVFNKMEDTAAKKTSWTRAPKANLLPDRFVLMLEDYQGIVQEFVGNAVPSPLTVSVDPSLDEDEQLKQEDGDLQLSEEMKWMADFDRAIQWGMGFKINLNEAQAQNGFRRLTALGLRLSADAAQGKAQVEELFLHHKFGKSGFSLLPQGIPTNNVEGKNAGHSRAADADADASFDVHFGGKGNFTPTTDWAAKRDGQWLAEWLGISPDVLQNTAYADGKDQYQAKAMNAALFPATLGYLMDTMMRQVFDADPETASFDDDAVLFTRWFFTHFVSGRGAVPAIRIGRQPYGILPAADFSKMEGFAGRLVPPEGISLPENWRKGMGDLYEILKKMSLYWQFLSGRADFVGNGKDPHQVLLNVIGLHPASVEFYQRYTLGLNHLWNLLSLNGAKLNKKDLDETLKKISASGDDPVAGGLGSHALGLLQWLGYQGDEAPEVLTKTFQPQQFLLKGAVVDDKPLSETEPVRAYTPPPPPPAPPEAGEPGKNYIQWLIEAARSSHETLRKEEGFLDNKPPVALLYLMLRHALMEGYADAGLRLYFQANLMDLTAVRTAKLDPPFIHVQAQKASSESRWSHFYKAEPQLTGSPNQLVIDHVTAQINLHVFPTRYVNEQIRALEHLQDAATAQLERAFAEHLDCVSYRLDAWIWGMKHFHLAAMRFPRQVVGAPGGGSPLGAGGGGGVYVGAYGWLEDVKPEFKSLETKTLQGDLAEIFQRKEDPPLVTDNTNYGYVHAPSLNHAVTAAVLRNAHKAYADDDNKQTFAINLSSERVRLAMSFLEGMRNGQSLAALLGYQLERGLHDRYNEAGKIFLDGVIFELRKAFPLVANRLKNTKDDDAAIEAIEARNVVNGLDLVVEAKKPDNADYPFGKNLPAISQAEADAINAEVQRLLDIHDAIADLAMAEGVHQVGLGNYDRAAATLDAFGKATFPVEPEVAQTPRSGVTLTHRVGIHLETGVDAATNAANPFFGTIAMTPRSKAEPALNKWLASILPPPANTGTWVTYFDGATDATKSIFVTQQELQLQPLDLLHLLDLESEQAMTELDDRLEHYARSQPNARPEADVTIEYTKPEATGRITFFQLSPMLKSLRALALSSRPLRPTDLALHEEASQDADKSVFFEAHRLTSLQALLTQLDGLKSNLTVGNYAAMKTRHEQAATLETEIAALEAQIANPAPGDDVDALKLTLATKQASLAAKRTEVIDNLDNLAMQAASEFQQIALFGFSQAGAGWFRDEIKRLLNLMIGKVAELRDRWQTKGTEYADLLVDYNALPLSATDQERFDLLAKMERLISTAPTLPGAGDTPAMVFATINTVKKPAFDAKLGTVQTFLANLPATLSGVRNGIANLAAGAPPLSEFDLQTIEMQDVEKQLLLFGEDLVSKPANLASVLQKRLDTANAKITEHNSTADSATQVKLLDAVAKQIFGDGFHLIPAFSLSGKQADELANAAAASPNLTKFQTDELPPDLRSDFPVDDWLYGIARVREKMKHWESLIFLAEAFGNDAPPLEPLQLPFRTNDRWLALQFRKPGEPEADFKVDADRLLYAAAWSAPFNKIAAQCGLLVDEWTEVIPAKTETTGITFHFDRPNAEPPQALLLAMPSVFRGHWVWQDLVDSLRETFQMARLRAVEPTQVDDTPFARFLPATLMPVTTHLLSLSTNLAVNNELYTHLNLNVNVE